MGPKNKDLPRRRKKVARKQLRVTPYFVSLLVLTGLLWAVAFVGTGFKSFPVPKLGLDLQGGMTMTLKASLPDGGAPDAARMEQARQIIEDRVNGTGVAEPEVYVEGSDHIVVNVAGKEANAEKLREVGAPAELRFREVLQGPTEDFTNQKPEDFVKDSKDDEDSDSDKGKESDSEEKADNSGSPSSSADASGSESPSEDKSSAKDDDKDGVDPAEIDKSVKEQRAKIEKKLGKDLVEAADALSGMAADAVKNGQQLSMETYQGLFQQLNTKADFTKFEDLSADEVAVLAPQWQYFVPTIGCGQLNGRAPGSISNVKEEVVACNRPSTEDKAAAKKQKVSPYQKHLLAAATVVGDDVSNANVQVDQQSAGAYAVGITFTNSGEDRWVKLAKKTVGRNVAIALDNEVVSAPTIQDGAASGGSVQITGGFTSDQANLLAEQLKYGSLPAAFTVETIDEVSPTLGIEQLKAGLLAGGLGLLLVVVYCFAYYRILGFVVIASLVAATVQLYPTIAMLGHQIGLTLTLAGVAGFIVAIGITADSFVVFFERLKDEIKEGRSVLSSVPRAWVRARRTIVSASVVNFMCAVVLYLVGIGAVKGFAFALGLSTIANIVLVFLFTHPFVAWMSRGRVLASARLSGIHTGHVPPSRPGLKSPGIRSLKES